MAANKRKPTQCSTKTFHRDGTYFRKADSKTVKRFKCLICSKKYSLATTDKAYRHHKRRLNIPIARFLASGVSQRRIALNFNISKNTVAKKLKFLAKFCKAEVEALLSKQESLVDHVQFDELQTFEHSKCKPLSVAMVVSKKGRQILGFEVASMPATGHLAKIARKKYGFRPDHRNKKLKALFSSVKSKIHPRAVIESDEASYYKNAVKNYFPKSKYKHYKGAPGAVTGQGELKKVRWDPLFSINHTFAMCRANINRLFRRTWNTTKDPERLRDHLWIYTWFHNTKLTRFPA